MIGRLEKFLEADSAPRKGDHAHAITISKRGIHPPKRATSDVCKPVRVFDEDRQMTR
jgi:hypothetical protein